MKSSFLLAASLLLLTTGSCRNDRKANRQIDIIDVAANVNNVMQVNLSRFTDNVVYIPLETRADALLKVTSDFDISGDYIVTTDGAVCMLFDLSGRFIRKFGTQGRGPEECQFISNLTISNDRKILFTSLRDLLEFNTDGSFSEKYSGFIDPEYYLSVWYLVDDSLLLCVFDNSSGRDEFKALLVSKNGVVKQEFKNYEVLENKGSRIYNGSPKLFKYNRSVFLKQQFNDTLFFLDSEYELDPQYIISVSDMKMPPDVREDFYEWTKRINEFISVTGVFQTTGYLFMTTGLAGKYKSNVLGIYDKRSKELVFCQPSDSENRLDRNGIYNDIDAGPRFFPVRMISDNTMAMMLDTKQLKDLVDGNDFKNRVPKYPKKKKQLEEFAGNLAEMDNPVLMLVTFRN